MIELMKRMLGSIRNVDDNGKKMESALLRTKQYNELARQRSIEYLGSKWIIHPDNFVKRKVQ